MKHKKAENTRYTFSMQVPITFAAFYLAYITLENSPSTTVLAKHTVYDWVAIPLATIGVIMYNCSAEPTQKVLIEKF
jgi:undecaprenyl pyrophosphate phosphatase UppP